MTAPEDGSKRIERQLDQERRKLQNLIAAIEGGSGTPSSLLKAIADREGAIKKLEGELRKAEDKPAGEQLPDVPSWVEVQLQELTGLLKSAPQRSNLSSGASSNSRSIPPKRSPAPTTLSKASAT